MKIKTYELKIPGVIEITFLNYGGIIQKIIVPDRHNRMGDVVLGFDHPEDYLKDHPYFGAIIGRYANRISEGKFIIDNHDYQLDQNEGVNTLHGGTRGLHQVFWNVFEKVPQTSYRLRYVSPDLEEGFPGEVQIEVTYTITSHRQFIIEYEARTNKKTYLNLTNHSYFNLSQNTENILDHTLWMNCSSYTETSKELIPTGKICQTDEKLDLLKEKSFREIILNHPEGLDHNFIFNEQDLSLPQIRLSHAGSGRTMTIYTSEPAVQCYTGNLLNGSITGKGSVPYFRFQGVCLETQHYPDSPNHPDFPSTLLKPGESYYSKTIYHFIHDDG